MTASADIDISKVDVYFSAEMCITGDGCSLQLKDFDIKVRKTQIFEIWLESLAQEY